MNFFEYQDRARQKTSQLVGLFILSVLFIIITIYLIAVMIFSIPHRVGGTRYSRTNQTTECLKKVEQYPGQQQIEYDTRGRVARVISLDPETRGQDITQKVCPTHSTALVRGGWWHPSLFLLIAVSTTAVIGAGSWYKVSVLKQGGPVIAQDLGGRLVFPEAASPAEKQLLNVVEEMAIAAGIPAPPVYVLDHEYGINAFAAGFKPSDAVIGVTRGCLEELNRDELQAVIGHEFSHIFNGDMRLNIRLIGMLHGILLIYIVGRIMLEVRASEERNKFWVFGLALMAIGSVGLVGGRIIKSAVSRQREFLADASAVQFTRNPDGLASALEKIANHRFKALIHSPHAETHSHLFFGSALRFDFLGELFATHPPVAQRIKRLKRFSDRTTTTPPSTPFSQVASQSPELPSSLVSGFARAVSSPVSQSNSEFSTSTTRSNHPSTSQLRPQLPEKLQTAIQEQQGAIAIVYSLVLDRQNGDLRSQQVEWLTKVEPNIVARTQEIYDELHSLNERDRLPLLIAATPALRQGTTAQCQQLLKGVRGLALVDRRWSLSEFIVQLILWQQLQSCLKPQATPATRFDAIADLWQDCLVMMVALAKVGQTTPTAIAYAFRAGVSQLPDAKHYSIPEVPPNCDLTQLKQSLDRLSGANEPLRQAIVKAGASIVMLDNIVTDQEAELLYAIAIVLEVTPPLCLRSSRQPARMRR